MRTSILLQLATIAAVNAQGQPWAQCGGIGWTGPVTCVSGYTCVTTNEYYAQCIAGSPSSAVATTSKTTTLPPATSSKTTTKAATTLPPVVTTTTTTKPVVVATTSAVSTLGTTTAPSVPAQSGLAFPGAEGFGRIAIGGRNGGSVYEVTNLLDSGAGSLRDAVSKPNRLVVFKVGGTIVIEARIVVSPSIYIAGQTAPGGGITVYGNGFSFSNAHNSIVRYIRIRMGKNGDSGKDGITIAEGRNMIFDHVSAAWGRDETFSISGTAENITVQNSIIGQGLETHSCGGLMETDGGISLFRNLYIDNKTRNPKVKGVNEFTNNVVYNWGGGGGYIAGDSAGTSFANIINNYFISGPSTSATAFTRGNANFHGFVSNNFYDSNRDGTLNGTPLCVSTTCYSPMVIEAVKYPYPPPNRLLTPAESVEHVIANVGNTFPSRDGIDARLISELKSFGKSGQLISDEKAAPMNGPGVTAPGTSTVSYAGLTYAQAEAKVNALVPSSY